MLKKEVIRQFAGVRKLADALGITREAIYQWPDVVPRLRQYEIREILAEREKFCETDTAPSERKSA
jgi:hypothetical protein